jgi:hypothetical protein
VQRVRGLREVRVMTLWPCLAHRQRIAEAHTDGVRPDVGIWSSPRWPDLALRRRIAEHQANVRAFEARLLEGAAFFAELAAEERRKRGELAS